MIQVTKEQAKMIRKHYPSVHIKRTTNKAYAEEHPGVIAMLKRGYFSKDVMANAK